MKQFVLALAISLFTVGAASAASCNAEAKTKKLAGAALTSFMTKCENDAKTSCSTKAGTQKLAGAAKDSFTKKCVSEAVN